ncbi:MAG: DNA-binding response regulator [Bacteroidia bacterium]|nr:DNA-binding response regulator [Bacteroidia bacterium]
MKFLIIEDEVMIAEVLKDYLTSFGYSQIQMAHDKPSAMQLINSFKPDIILLDIRMERERVGLEIGSFLNQNSKTSFIYITAHSDTEILMEIMATNPAGYLNKPIKKTDLLGNILRITKTQVIADTNTNLSEVDKAVIIDIENYLRTNIYNEFDGVEAIAQKFGLSVSKLKTNFKLVYNKPIYQYFNDLQMKSAFDLIKKDKLLVKEVAARFNYESQGRFSEAFKRVNGILPSEI